MFMAQPEDGSIRGAEKCHSINDLISVIVIT
jgi:hypothetical protein